METKTCGCTLETCGCCAGTQTWTPAATANRPGLSALHYRVGTHGAFFETMKARLAGMQFEAPGVDNQTLQTFRPLDGLTTRDSSDPAIALLDGWATVGDVLTFYQERIANEGYLRTATERRSVLELARLVGYALRPGVASTVYLAYTLEDRQIDPVEIPAGARSQSIPGPGELPQSFETSEKLLARREWNNLRPRMTQPQKIGMSENGKSIDTDAIYFQGTATNLKVNDPLLFDFSTTQILRHVKTVEADYATDRTKVTLQEAADGALVAKAALATAPPSKKTLVGASGVLDAEMLKALTRPPSVQPVSSTLLPRDASSALTGERDTLPQILGTLQPSIAAVIYNAWAGAAPTAPDAPKPVKVYALRLKATPFGSNAPLKPLTDAQGRVVGYEEWPLVDPVTVGVEFDNSNYTALVSITRNKQRQSRAIPDPENTKPIQIGEDVVNVSVDKEDQTIQFNFELESSLPSKLSRVIKIVPMSDVIGLKTYGGSQEIKIGTADDPSKESYLVTGGATVQYAAPEHRGTIYLSMGYQPLLRIEDDTFLAPDTTVVYLGVEYEQILPASWVAILRSDKVDSTITNASTVQGVSKVDYGITGKSTKLTLKKEWLSRDDRLLSALRGTTVFAQSEELQLAERPYQPDTKILDAAGKTTTVEGDKIELERLYDGLQSGRWIIVSGERDIKNTSGIRASELVMLAGVQQTFDPLRPGDKVHSTLILANKLAYSYKRETVTIYANVVKATHGETRNETLGSGDGSQALQSFGLKQPPLTFVPAPNPAGVDSTLKVYVNDVEWHETDTLAGLESKDRYFVTKTDDVAKTTVIFGNGKQGARLPTGVENVKAVYRNGIGKGGNVLAEQISLLMTRPLGVKEVINPLRASGGADKESRDQARDNAPLGVMALDRLVSVQDYADFTRTFAGIAKAQARRLSDGKRELLHLTIAGADDVPIDPVSDLYRNLLLALRQFGDPDLPLQVDSRELKVLVLSAKVSLAPDYLWEPVVTQIRAALLDAFGFQKRNLGQSVLLSEVVSLIQNMEGVDYVDVDTFGGIPEKKVDGTVRRLLTLDEIADSVNKIVNPANDFLKNCTREGICIPRLPAPRVDVNTADFERGTLRPAQLAIFSPTVPDTLILNQIT